MNKHPKEIDSVSIIYNPNSTGDGKAMAEDLKKNLRNLAPGLSVSLIPTKHAGHAEELAYDLSKETPRPLIISSSGDGGYHEVVNGVMRARSEGAVSIAGLLPAGNANDHFHDTHGEDIAKAIVEGKLQRIDLLQLDTTVGGQPFSRYAHSYIGFGLTPKIGQELNKVDLNWFNQIWIVTKALLVLQPVSVSIDGKRRSYDSLIFSNVGKMSKVLHISEKATNDDGKFEVTLFKRRHKLRLIQSLFKASTTGLSDATQVEEYDFETLKETLVQLDGEIETVDAASAVHISIAPKVLECIV